MDCLRLINEALNKNTKRKQTVVSRHTACMIQAVERTRTLSGNTKKRNLKDFLQDQKSCELKQTRPYRKRFTFFLSLMPYKLYRISYTAFREVHCAITIAADSLLARFYGGSMKILWPRVRPPDRWSSFTALPLYTVDASHPLWLALLELLFLSLFCTVSACVTSISICLSFFVRSSLHLNFELFGQFQMQFN